MSLFTEYLIFSKALPPRMRVTSAAVVIYSFTPLLRSWIRVVGPESVLGMNVQQIYSIPQQSANGGTVNSPQCCTVVRHERSRE
jgi:hypothetical protein